MDTENRDWRQAPDQITAWGIGDQGPAPDPAQVAACERWLREFATPQKAINQRAYSYSLKHVAERWTGQYVSNGAFIQAAVNLGYRYRHAVGYNVWFNMAVRKTPREA